MEDKELNNIRKAIRYLWMLMYAGDTITDEEKQWFRKFIEEIKD